MSSNYDAMATDPRWYGTELGPTLPRQPAIPAAIEARAYDRARARAVQAQNLNLGQTLGEMPDTVKYLAALVGGALRSIRALKRRDLPELKRSNLKPHAQSEDAATVWLGYQYGLKPLMSDVYEIAKIISDGLNDPKSTAHVVVDQPDDTFGPIPLAGGMKGKVSGTFRRGIKVSYTFRISNPTLFSLTQYGITNPLELAWDLVPVSFAVDWFTGIGGFLRSLTQPVGLTFHTGYATKYMENIYEVEYLPSYVLWSTGNLPNFSVKQECFYRTPLFQFGGVLPHLKIGLSPGQLASLAALLTAVNR